MTKRDNPQMQKSFKGVEYLLSIIGGIVFLIILVVAFFFHVDPVQDRADDGLACFFKLVQDLLDDFSFCVAGSDDK